MLSSWLKKEMLGMYCVRVLINMVLLCWWWEAMAMEPLKGYFTFTLKMRFKILEVI